MTETIPELWFVALLTGIALTLGYLYRKPSKSRAHACRLPLPPGPRGLPIIGNLLDVPNDRPWLGYRKLADKYGAETFD